MTKKQCPLGEACDLTTAWMLGASKAQDQIKAQAAEIERLRGDLAKAGRDLNVARYGQPDFAWSIASSIHKQEMADLVDKLAKVTAAYRLEAMRRDDYSHADFDHHIATLTGDNP